MPTHTKERRSGHDRRGWETAPPMPFFDCRSVLVASDRRKLPDRRLSNIQVRWWVGDRQAAPPVAAEQSA